MCIRDRVNRRQVKCKGVKSEKIKVFPLVCSKYLSSWTGPDMTGVRVLVKNNVFFELLRQKWCRIIYKLHQKIFLGSETCEIRPKVVIWSCPDLSRRTSTYCKPTEILLFFQILHFSIFINKLIIFIKSSVSPNTFLSFFIK